MWSIVKRWLHGFSYAYDGLLYTLSTQRNMKFHACAALVILLMGLGFKVSALELLLIMFAVCLVMSAECMNTAVERAVDLAMPDQHPWAKAAKDAAAASVLLTAVFAVAVSIYVFGERIGYGLAGGHEVVGSPMNVMVYGTIICFNFILLLSVQAFLGKARAVWRPSLGFGLLATVLCIAVYIIRQWEYFYVVLALYLVAAGIRLYYKQAIVTMISSTLIGMLSALFLLWIYN